MTVASLPGPRELAVGALGAAVGVRLSPGDPVAEVALRAVVLAIAAIGGMRLAHRALTHDDDSRPDWWSAPAGVAFAAGAVIPALALLAPRDAIVCACLPWAMGRVGDTTPGRRHAASAGWLAVAGVGSVVAAGCLAFAGLVGALSRWRLGGRALAAWVLVAVASSAWWVAALVLAGPGSSARPAYGAWSALREVVGAGRLSATWLVLVASWPLAVLCAAIAWRSRMRVAPAGLLLIASAGAAAAGSAAGNAWLVPAPGGLPAEWIEAPPAGAAPSAALALVGVAAVLAAVPLTRRLAAQVGGHSAVRLAAVATIAVLAALIGISVAYGAHERGLGNRLDQSLTGFSTHA